MVVLSNLEQTLVIDEVKSFQDSSDTRFDDLADSECQDGRGDVHDAVHAHEGYREVLTVRKVNLPGCLLG